MPNILLINTNCSWNKGSAAHVICTAKTLRRLIPDANFVFWSIQPELDSKTCAARNIKVVGSSLTTPFSKYSGRFTLFKLLYYLFRCALWSALREVGLNADKLLDDEVLTEYAKADIIIDLSGDTLSDKYNISLFPILRILMGRCLGKKIVIYSQSIGPFRKISIPFARFCLNGANLIVIRENITKKYLKEIGVNNPSTHLAADVAFLLEPAPLEKVQEILLKENVNIDKKKGPLIGIGTSAVMYRLFESKNNMYVALMAEIADYLIEKLNAQVVFVSHVIVPPRYGYLDDRFVGERIYQLVRNKNRIKSIKGDYSPEELKGIIGRCTLFIGTRMHSNIASTSMHVPTIALAWSHKYKGIMRMLEQEKFVCDFRTMTSRELISKIDDVWSNRDEVSKKLASKTRELEESVLFSGRLIKKLIESP